MKKIFLGLFLMITLISLAGCGRIEAPTGLEATGDADRILLTWAAVLSDDLTGYQVYRKAPGGTFAELGTAAANQTEYNDTTAEIGTVYDYYVTALGKKESEPSAVVTNVRGTRLTNQGGDFTIPAGETRVIDGAVSVGGSMTVPAGTKLYILGNSTLTFSDTSKLSVFAIRGLFRTVAGPANPVSIIGTGNFGFTIHIDGAPSYNTTTDEGTLLSYALIDKLGRGDVNSSLCGILIAGCVPKLAQLKVIPNPANTLYFYVETSSGAIIEHCSFTKMGLSLLGDLRTTPTLIHGNSFTRSYYAALFMNSPTGPNINAAQMTGNSFECTGTGDFYLYSVQGAGQIFLGGNFCHDSSGARIDPGTLIENSSVTVNEENLLDSEPADVGPEW